MDQLIMLILFTLAFNAAVGVQDKWGKIKPKPTIGY